MLPFSVDSIKNQVPRALSGVLHIAYVYSTLEASIIILRLSKGTVLGFSQGFHLYLC